MLPLLLFATLTCQAVEVLPAPVFLPAPRFVETLPVPRFGALQRGPCSSACTCGCQSFGYCACGSLAPVSAPPTFYPARAVRTQYQPAPLQGGPIVLPCPPGR